MNQVSPPDWLRMTDEVRDGLRAGRPVVALESTVLSQGLPRPLNLRVGRELEADVRAAGAIPATVAVLDGVPTLGLAAEELERIATDESVEKLSTRDLPLAMARSVTGGTTVASTAWIAAAAGVQVFATGGIGGVHRGLPLDVSADLTELQRTRLLVVCAGAKSILDLPATRELLETLGILLLGWRTDRMPGFYTPGSDLAVDGRVESAAEVASIWAAHRRLDAPGGILLCVPVPEEAGLDPALVEDAVREALVDAERVGITGKAITPHLLGEVGRVTGGRSLDANVALLRNNARVAAAVSVELSRG
jgi:pseudouridylate synthase